MSSCFSLKEKWESVNKTVLAEKTQSARFVITVSDFNKNTREGYWPQQESQTDYPLLQRHPPRPVQALCGGQRSSHA
jgi:hypothetical protein